MKAIMTLTLPNQEFIASSCLCVHALCDNMNVVHMHVCVCMHCGLAVGHERLELHACMDTVEIAAYKQITVIRLASLSIGR